MSDALVDDSRLMRAMRAYEGVPKVSPPLVVEV
jgi:hypothetical protein